MIIVLEKINKEKVRKGDRNMWSRTDKEIMGNKLFAAQQVISEVVMDLIKDGDTKDIAVELSGLNGKIDDVRKRIKENKRD